jgi:AAA15 family ATPase/GTPase
MITHFYIDNFKSLVNFELDLAKFTCLIGLNGAGKSTVLQALDFTSAVMSGEIDLSTHAKVIRNFSPTPPNTSCTRVLSFS